MTRAFDRTLALRDAGRPRAERAGEAERVGLSVRLEEGIGEKIESVQSADGGSKGVVAVVARQRLGMCGCARSNVFAMGSFYDA